MIARSLIQFVHTLHDCFVRPLQPLQHVSMIIVLWTLSAFSTLDNSFHCQILKISPTGALLVKSKKGSKPPANPCNFVMVMNQAKILYDSFESQQLITRNYIQISCTRFPSEKKLAKI
jgi:hypothetical protein